MDEHPRIKPIVAIHLVLVAVLVAVVAAVPAGAEVTPVAREHTAAAVRPGETIRAAVTVKGKRVTIHLRNSS